MIYRLKEQTCPVLSSSLHPLPSSLLSAVLLPSALAALFSIPLIKNVWCINTTKLITDLVSLSKGFQRRLGKEVGNNRTHRVKATELHWGSNFWKCVTAGACSSVSVQIAVSVTDYGVCNIKRQTSQGRRGEKRLCELVFFVFAMAVALFWEVETTDTV